MPDVSRFVLLCALLSISTPPLTSNVIAKQTNAPNYQIRDDRDNRFFDRQTIIEQNCRMWRLNTGKKVNDIRIPKII